jgi:uncharacterized membrane protein
VELYDWLLLIHILAAIAWVGGATTINILATRIRRAGTPEDLVAFTGLAEWIGPRVYSLASLVVLAMGIWMVAISDAWTIGQLWIVLALIGFAITAIGGAAYFGPESKRIREAAEAEGPESPRAQALIRRIFLVSWFDLILLVLIVADMVLKPGL